MKRIATLIATVFFAASATGCDSNTYYFDKEQYVDKIEKIELRYAKPGENVYIMDLEEGKPQFNLEHSSVKETLDADKIPSFVDEFSTITFHLVYKCSNEPVGQILVMYLTNGNYIVSSLEILNKKGYDCFCEFDSNCEFVKFFGKLADGDKYDTVLSNYFTSYTKVGI